jgi:transcription factor STE12
LSFRFQAFGRPVKNSKKFEEGIFSDLRNLKSGTDASLEEPKSPFLDFLYKNNCIRTQKKQKVFYWYSVPHDRLFLDALERDLKREKMGQEPTTVAVSEPALSFEFDSSQSLFEQLTKAQQTNSSSFTNNVQSFAQSTSPQVRADSMPAPPVMPQQMPQPVMDDPLAHAPNPYMQQMPTSMPSVANTMAVKTREREFGSVQFDRNGIPLSQLHQRANSMPAFMEYSPAPSLMSQYDEYGSVSNPRMSFEPMTPPQHSMGLAAEPTYIANDETGLYSAIPDLGMSNNFNPLMQMPPSNMVNPQFTGATRSFPQTNVYSVIEGSPTYKQRRRRSSISQGISAAVTSASGTPQMQRPSDLRRSMSASVVPQTVQEVEESTQDAVQRQSSPHSGSNGYAQQKPEPFPDMSRHGTPLATIEDSPVQQHASLGNEEFPAFENGSFDGAMAQNPLVRSAPGVFRRARSATMMELGPYPTKSHSCPIPTCGRLFKRLEHLKR